MDNVAPGAGFLSRPGSSADSLFAWQYPPVASATGLGVVLCSPMGAELMSSYRAIREFAETLARAGIAVIRVDYAGTGDSSGDDLDPDRVEAWMDSVDRAIDALRASPGITAIGLVGVRLGATLACVCASRRDDVACVVAWAPCRTGKIYVRELKMLAASERAETAGERSGDEIEAGGFTTSPATVAALSKIDLTKLSRPPAPKVLIVRRDDGPVDDRVADAFAAAGAEVTRAAWTGYGAMMAAPHRSVAPVALFENVAGWLRALPGVPAVPPDVSRIPCTLASSAVVDRSALVRERPVRFGPGGRLFGMLSTPVETVARRKTAVVLLNTGANYHVGPNRLYVDLARTWAAQGYVALRLDLSGIGDSGVRPGGRANSPYDSGGIDDLEAAIEELTRQGATDVAAVGLCSGAYASFHACLKGAPLRAQIMINPQSFYWKEGDNLDAAPAVVAERVNHYRTSVRSLANWKRALTGRIEYRALARLATHRVRDLAGVRIRKLASLIGVWRDPEDLGRDLQAISARGISTLIVYAEGDAGIEYLRGRAGGRLHRLQRTGKLVIDTIANADHTFTSRGSREKLIRRLTAHVLQELA